MKEFKATILLVEDDLVVRNATSHMLQHLGYQVLEAATCHEALELLQNHAADLLLTDIILSATNGVRVAEVVLLRHPSIKVLYTTGYGDELTRRLGIDEESVVRKPFSAERLEMAVLKRLSEQPNARRRGRSSSLIPIDPSRGSPVFEELLANIKTVRHGLRSQVRQS